MSPHEKISTSVVVIHIITIMGLMLIKNIGFFEKLRSSIEHPAYKGTTALQAGGLVIIPVTLAIFNLLLPSFISTSSLTLVLFYMPIVILFVIGFIDDYRTIPATIKLFFHFTSSIIAVIILYHCTNFAGLSSITSTAGIIIPGIFMVLTICWMINSTNFIDGMDLFLTISILPGVIIFTLLNTVTQDDFVFSLVFALLLSSLLGFMWFNWPRASIYMGDAGTFSIGLIIATGATYILAKHGSIAGFIPFAYLIVDTTFTLMIRISKKLEPLKSHNQHSYQLAAQNGRTDNKIRIQCLILNVFNSALAYGCFYFSNIFVWQVLLSTIAFAVSFATFMQLRSPPNTTQIIK